MKFVKAFSIAALAIAAVVVIAAPLGPLPGFFIGGTDTEAPTSWPDTTNVHEIRLKVPGTLPRVVIIWVIAYEGALHVVGSPDSGWVKQLGEGGAVAMRMGDETYALTATRLRDNTGPILAAYVAKYRPDYPDIVADFPSAEEAAGQFALFRLDRS